LRRAVTSDTGGAASRLTAILTAGMVGVLVAHNQLGATLIAGMVLLLLLLLIRPAWLTIVTVAIIWLVPAQTAPGGMLDSATVLNWLGMVVVPAISLLVVAVSWVDRSRRQEPVTSVPQDVMLGAMAYAVTLVVLGLGHGNAPAGVIQSAVAYLRYPVLFLALVYSGFERRYVLAVVGTLVSIGAIAGVESIIRHLTVGARWDSISLLLGSYGTFSLGAVFVLMACAIAGAAATSKLRLWHALAFIMIGLVSLWGEIKALTIAIPLSVLGVLVGLSRAKRLTWRLIAVVAGIVLGVGLLVSAWGAFWGENDDLSRASGDLASVFAGEMSLTQASNRVGWMARSVEYMARHDALLFGFGPGSGLAGTATGGQDLMLGSISGIGRTQVSVLLWEGGVFGLGIYWVMLLLVVAHIWRGIGPSVTGIDLLLMVTLLGFSVYYVLIGPMYDLVWRYDVPSMAFWVLSAYVVGRREGLPAPHASLSALQ